MNDTYTDYKHTRYIFIKNTLKTNINICRVTLREHLYLNTQNTGDPIGLIRTWCVGTFSTADLLEFSLVRPVCPARGPF